MFAPCLSAHSAAASQYRKLLDERQNLASQLSREAGASQEVMDTITAESRELNSISGILDTDRRRIQLGRLNASFDEMKKRKSVLLDKYTRAFGTSQERPALQALIGHMQSMSQNRNEAKALGSDTAAREASQVEAELEKYKRR